MEKRRRNNNNKEEIVEIEKNKEKIKVKEDLINENVNEEMINEDVEEQEDFVDELNSKNKIKTKATAINKIAMIIWLAIFVALAYCLAMLGLYTIGKVSKDKVPFYDIIDNVIVSFFPKYYEVEEIYTINVAAFGSIFTSSNIENQYEDVDLENTFSYLKEEYSDYDLILADLKMNYSTNATSDFNNNLLTTFKDIGLTAVITANSLNATSTESDIDYLLDSAADAGIETIGLDTTNDVPYIYESEYMKIGVLSYYIELDENDELITDESTLEYNCYYSEEKSDEDIAYLNENDVDYIIAYLDYEDIDTDIVDINQKEYADILIEKGVNVIFETGRSDSESVYEDIYELDNGTQNHAYIMYSLGDMFGIDEDGDDISVVGDITFSKKIIKDNLGNVIESKTVSYMTINNPNILYTDYNYDEITIYPISSSLENEDLDDDLKITFSNIYEEYISVLNIK